MAFTDSEVEEILSRNKPWLYAKARQFPVLPADDLVQEALIAMWKELKSFNRDVPVDVHLRRRAYWKMLDLAGGRPWTTCEPYNKTRIKEVPCALGEIDKYDIVDDSTISAMDRVEYSTCRSDIDRVFTEILTPKQAKYLTLKYIDQKNSTELTEAFGYEPHSIIVKSTKTKLKTAMAHLEDMVV